MESATMGIVGIVVGGIITWLVTFKYYIKAANELKKETESLKALTKFLGIKLHEKGVIDLPVENGKPTYNQRIGSKD